VLKQSASRQYVVKCVNISNLPGYIYFIEKKNPKNGNQNKRRRQ